MDSLQKRAPIPAIISTPARFLTVLMVDLWITGVRAQEHIGHTVEWHGR
jgi:hypothetical protein